MYSKIGFGLANRVIGHLHGNAIGANYVGLGNAPTTIVGAPGREFRSPLGGVPNLGTT